MYFTEAWLRFKFFRVGVCASCISIAFRMKYHTFSVKLIISHQLHKLWSNHGCISAERLWQWQIYVLYTNFSNVWLIGKLLLLFSTGHTSLMRLANMLFERTFVKIELLLSLYYLHCTVCIVHCQIAIDIGND